MKRPNNPGKIIASGVPALPCSHPAVISTQRVRIIVNELMPASAKEVEFDPFKEKRII